MKILIVEDEKRLADSLADLLRSNGMETEVAYDGGTGYEYAASGVFDLMILDVMLPVQSGLDVARRLRGERNGTPILMLTARGELEDRISGLDAGADYYLTKPFDTGELLACVRALLRRQVEPGLWIRGSAVRLGQVVEILLDNANKYAAPGGAVTLELRREDKRRCLLRVCSQGAAIPNGELERIFLRFYRADAARSASGSYGLGLSIARSVAAEHRGRIWAESNEEGNVFCVRLPLERRPRE